MKWFGIKFPDYDWDEPLVPTPVGTKCGHCGELIDRMDSGCLMPNFEKGEFRELSYHRECFLRGVFGSVAHQKRECSCFGGTGEDDPKLTIREAALAAVEYFEMHRAPR